MRAIKKISDYKNRLLLSTALTAAILFSDVPTAGADVCSSSTNGADCTVTGIVYVDSITAGNINSAKSQKGVIIVRRSGTFNGKTYLLQLRPVNDNTNMTFGSGFEMYGRLFEMYGRLFINSE